MKGEYVGESEDIGLHINQPLYPEVPTLYHGAQICKCGKKIAGIEDNKPFLICRHFRGVISHYMNCKIYRESGDSFLKRGSREVVYNEKG